MSTAGKHHHRSRGSALILSMIFVLVFSALAVSLATISGANVEVASNHHRLNTALLAAQSGLQCAQYIVHTVSLGATPWNYVSDTEATAVWNTLCNYVDTQNLDGKTVTYDANELTVQGMTCDGGTVTFDMRFCRDANDPRTIYLESTGVNGQVSRRVGVAMDITKDREVLTYAIASRGRMWLTGDTTIHGDLYSSWDRPEISPFNMTSDSSVLGTINTVLDLDDILAEGYQMETLDANGLPFDTEGNPLGTNYADRYYSPDDEILAYHEGINYSQPEGTDVPGMSISDYNTDVYTSGLAEIPSCPTENRVVEYFPHAAGNYAAPQSSSSLKVTRHVYEDMTFTDATLPRGRQALFRNCTFNGVLYVDCNPTSTYYTSYTNNVRFQDCTFNGVIVTETPQPFNWQKNCLYFTGGATFNNQSSVQEATILAPHFNVNLGNTNPEQSDNNVLTGAIVGGIVDIRGNAQIYGTIISMFDTTPYSSGYVTNIGATLEDGGSETTELGDIGVISITPEEDTMLPSGITSPIVIKPDQSTYSEA